MDLLAMCQVPGVSWHFIAREAQRPGGMARLTNGMASEAGSQADEGLSLMRAATSSVDDRRAIAARTIDAALADGYRLTTVLDDDYPINLRLIPNLPPFLFYLGDLRPDDAYSVAVVGTRRPSPEGRERARGLARGLVAQGITVLSGFARGVDTAVHDEAVSAGGRTIAVLGCGIRQLYPRENGPLARQIVEHGAIVSQFWPDAPPTRTSFPRRNVVTSGMGQGTVVIEALSASGTSMQARLAFEHGKLVFLLSPLVASQRWARDLLSRPRVYEVDTAEDIWRWLRSPQAQQDRAQHVEQLGLAL